MCSSLSFLLWRENKRRDDLYGKAGQGVEAEVVDAIDERDNFLPQQAKFRYII